MILLGSCHLGECFQLIRPTFGPTIVATGSFLLNTSPLVRVPTGLAQRQLLHGSHQLPTPSLIESSPILSDRERSWRPISIALKISRTRRARSSFGKIGTKLPSLLAIGGATTHYVRTLTSHGRPLRILTPKCQVFESKSPVKNNAKI